MDLPSTVRLLSVLALTLPWTDSRSASRIDSAGAGSVGVALSVSSDAGANAQTKHKLSSMSWLLVFIADQITGISRASRVIGEKPFVSPYLQKIKRCNARNLQSLLAYSTGHLPHLPRGLAFCINAVQGRLWDISRLRKKDHHAAFCKRSYGLNPWEF